MQNFFEESFRKVEHFLLRSHRPPTLVVCLESFTARNARLFLIEERIFSFASRSRHQRRSAS